MQVQNKAHKNTELNVGGKIVRADEHGVYDVDDEIGRRLLGLPGFAKPRMTVELQNAYAEIRKTSAALKVAQDAHDAAKLRMSVAQAQADRGQGTPLDGSVPLPAAPRPPAPVTATPEAPKPAEPPQEPPKSREEPPESQEEAPKSPPPDLSRLKAKFGTPTMRWKTDDLITYARALGIEADTGWGKADILHAIEAHEEE